MDILVIDDAIWNQRSAERTLSDHQLTIAKSAEEAYRILEKSGDFDAVLTDVYMPVDSCGALLDQVALDYANDAEGQVAAGLVFALAAVNWGIKTAICSDRDHHRSVISTLLDCLYGTKSKRLVAPVDSRDVTLNAASLQQVSNDESQPVTWGHEENDFIPTIAYLEKYIPNWEQKTMGYTDNQVPRVKDWKKVLQVSQLFPELNST